jgi:hypothetical protein
MGISFSERGFLKIQNVAFYKTSEVSRVMDSEFMRLVLREDFWRMKIKLKFRAGKSGKKSTAVPDISTDAFRNFRKTLERKTK